MGPRFCKRGNFGLLNARSRLKEQLQWGHAFVSVETTFAEPPVVEPLPLQWGHAFVSVETRADSAQRQALRGFNGATLL